MLCFCFLFIHLFIYFSYLFIYFLTIPVRLITWKSTRPMFAKIWGFGISVAAVSNLKLVFRFLEGCCHGNHGPRQFVLALYTELSSGDIRQMASAYGKKRNWFAGRRRLVAQPGGLTSGFDPHLVCRYYAQQRFVVSLIWMQTVYWLFHASSRLTCLILLRLRGPFPTLNLSCVPWIHE